VETGSQRAIRITCADKAVMGLVKIEVSVIKEEAETKNSLTQRKIQPINRRVKVRCLKLNSQDDKQS